MIACQSSHASPFAIDTCDQASLHHSRLLPAPRWPMPMTSPTFNASIIDLAFEQGGIEGLDAAATKRYIRFIADRRLEGLMLAPRWGVATNPLPFVDYLTAGPEHANFFETRPTEYAKAALTGSWSDVWGRHPH
jgi:hypothetical protein